MSLCIRRQQRHCNVLLLRVRRVRVGMVMVTRRVRGRGVRVRMVMRATATEAAALDALDDEHGHDRCDSAH